MSADQPPLRRDARASILRRFSGLVRASHPFPIVMVVSLTALAGIASARDALGAGRLALAVVAMLCSQLGIGWSNDYIDRARDARFQPQKPLPSGLVAPGLVLGLVPLSLTLSLAIGALLGATVEAWLIAGTACGLIYNLALKETRLSWLPYVVAFAVLPPFVWSATDSYRGVFLWLYAFGAPLAVAAHLANSLPDIEADTAANLGGLAVRLGPSRAIAALYACVLLPPAAIAASSVRLHYDGVTLALTLGIHLALVAASVPAYRASPFHRGAAIGFRLVAPACVILAAGWLAAIR